PPSQTRPATRVRRPAPSARGGGSVTAGWPRPPPPAHPRPARSRRPPPGLDAPALRSNPAQPLGESLRVRDDHHATIAGQLWKHISDGLRAHVVERVEHLVQEEGA